MGLMGMYHPSNRDVGPRKWCPCIVLLPCRTFLESSLIQMTYLDDFLKNVYPSSEHHLLPACRHLPLAPDSAQPHEDPIHGSTEKPVPGGPLPHTLHSSVIPGKCPRRLASPREDGSCWATISFSRFKRHRADRERLKGTNEICFCFSPLLAGYSAPTSQARPALRTSGDLSENHQVF